LAKIEWLSKLRSLTLRGGYGLEMEPFLRSPHVRNLESLALGGMPLSSEWMRLLGHGENWTGLRELTLAHNNLILGSMELLIKSPLASQLRAFKLFSDFWGNNFIHLLAEESAFKRLERLTFMDEGGDLALDNLLQRDTLDRFGESSFKECLQEVTFSGTRLRNVNPYWLMGWVVMPHLHTLRVPRLPLHNAVWIGLPDLLAMLHLQVLDLRDSSASAASIERLSEFSVISKLSLLGLSGQSLQHPQFEKLITSPHWSGNTGLLLANVGITAKELQALRQKYADRLPYVRLEEAPS
jgi:hypothetical protein